MNRDRVVVALLALLTVAALGLGATAIDEIDPSPAGDGDVEPQVGSGGAAGPASEPVNYDLDWLYPIVLVVLALSLVLAAYLLLDAMTPRVALILVLVLVLGILTAIVVEQVSLGEYEGLENGTFVTEQPRDNLSAGQYDETGGEQSAPTTPSATLALFLAIIALGGVAIYHFTRTEPDRSSAVDDGEMGEAGELGRAAGRAADSIEATSLENGVYRAWREMTDVLDVPARESTTPGEFAEAAIAAGLAPDDVETLTDVFRDVRYGDVPATAEREQQATETLRHIEAAHGTEGDSEPGDTGGEQQ